VGLLMAVRSGRAVVRWLVVLCQLGCASNGSVTTEQAAPVRSDTPAPAHPAPQPEAVLDAAGLDRVKVGAVLPPDLAVAERYHASYYADAQPLEGFEFGSRGALAIVDGGAFAAFGNGHPGQMPPADVRAATLAAGAAGRLTVRMIVVTDPAITTARGVRAGATLATVRSAFPDAPLKRLPPLWEDPTCLIEGAGLAVFFDGCPRTDQEPSAKGAKVVRIVARR
jgi:hypothetical protein